MFHPFPVSRSRPPILITLGVVALALLMVALAPGSARAACAASVGTGNVVLTDAIGDNEPEAPDIAAVNNVLDAGCELDVEVQLIPPDLQPGQYLVVQFDLDESSGARATEVRDVEVRMDANGAMLNDFVQPLEPLPTFGQYGFTVSLDRLGVTRSPSNLGIAAVGVHDPTPSEPTSGDETRDHAPESHQLMHRVPISFAPPAPPPPPPSSQPPAVLATQAKRCVVPKIKRLSVRKAKARLKKAKCKYKVRGKGRVRSVSPKAGTRTSATVQVRAKRKKRKKPAR